MTDPFDLSAATVLITGGGTGLGKQFAKTLAQAGARVIIAARRVDKLQETVAEISASGGSASCVPMDVCASASITEAVAACNAMGPLTALVNNAGASSEHMLAASSEEDWDKVHNTNLKGAWLVAREVSLGMAQSGGGSIVNISSALATAVQKGTGPYAAAKAGLEQLTRGMAVEWARYGIRVNAIAPGYIYTDLAAGFLDTEAGQRLVKALPQRRLGKPEDLDGVIRLLCSDASSYMTGAVIPVDGGMSLAIV